VSWRRLAALAATAWWLVATAPVAWAAEPTPTPIGGDPRSPGQGPGLVGDPLLAIGGVLVIGLAAVLVTGLWVRATRR
jgi:hypothetical protein